MMKRSTSAPMIPELLEQQKSPLVGVSLQHRRGISTSNVSLPCDFAMKVEISPRRQPLASPLPLSRINSPTSRQIRVEQLKKEECIDERTNEREVQERILLNQSCDELRLDSDEPEFRPMETMEVWPSHPSPSRFVSPSSPLTSRVRSRSLTPTSPNSARTFSTYRRSLSPVHLRPSTLRFGQKRKRENDMEDMETSPTYSVPAKKIQLGYSSPLNLSPCASPLMGNSPLHHSFSTTSRKSSTTQSESTPLSSPSSTILNSNPFATNYDSGNCEQQWQSGNTSGCSSSSHSPSLGMLNRCGLDLLHRHVQLEELKINTQFGSPGIIINDDHRGVMDSTSTEVNVEAPTPLSPKGLLFRQKLFPLAQATLPSPIPRSLAGSGGGGGGGGGSGASGGVVSNQEALLNNNNHLLRVGPPNPGVSVPNKSPSLQHDKHFSPFNSDPSSSSCSSSSSLSHVPGYPHTLQRHIRPIAKARSHLSTSSLGTSRQMNKPVNELSPSHSPRVLPGNDHNRTLVSLNVSKSASSIMKPSPGVANSLVVEDGLTSPRGSLSVLLRHRHKRRVSETSTDSREDSLMESDGSSLEESLEMYMPDKDFDTKIVRTMS